MARLKMGSSSSSSTPEAENVDTDERTVLWTLTLCGALFVGFVVVAAKSGATHLYEDEGIMEPCDALTKHRVLVTGFEEFGNMTIENPSKTAALALNGTCGDKYCATSEILAVDSSGASYAASHLDGVSGVLHLGFEDIAKGLKLEVMAKNLMGNASSAGWGFEVDCGPTVQAVQDGPCLEATTAPLDRIVLRSLFANETKEIWSRDPGAFYCNECYYRTLRAIRSNSLTVPRLHSGCSNERRKKAVVTTSLIPALFVHLPNPNVEPLSDYLPVLLEILHVLGNPPIHLEMVGR